MKKRNVLCAAALAVLVLAGAYTAVSAAAGSSDPLVTMSYLTGKFTPQMQSEMKIMVDSKALELTRQFDQAMAGSATPTPAPTSTPAPGAAGENVFSVVTLKKGQTLVGDVGCEVMLRVGAASCAGTASVGLIDESTAETLAGGRALVKNHLYMVTISTRSVTASADTVKLLARGPYTVI